MRDLWDAISEQPALLIFAVLALLSWVGNLAGGAAKKAQQEAQRKAQAQLEQARPRGAALAPRGRVQQQQMQPQSATSSAPTAEEIAAEIRRVMGFESEPRRLDPTPPPPPVVVADHARRAAQRGPAAPTAKPRPTAPSARVRPPRGPQRRRFLDLRNPAAAIVLMEVLGKPRALRGFDD